MIDDDILLTASPLVQADDGLWRFWFTTEAVDYWPVSNSSFWLEWRIWGANPTGYRVTNLALHIVESFLLWRILSMLAIPGAFIGALLFALHPVNAESVAWISQRKTLLAMLFAQLATIAYLKSESVEDNSASEGPDRSTAWYIVAVVSFAWALLSKISIAVFPALLALCLQWNRGLRQRDLPRLLPLFLTAGALVLVNLWVRAGDPHIQGSQVGRIDALLGAAATGWFYLGKALAPIDLAFMYPSPLLGLEGWLRWFPLVAALASSAALLAYRTPARPLLFAWSYYWIALLPALGFTETAYVEDHYQHLALCGVTAIGGAAWAWLRATPALRRWIIDAALAAGIVLLAVATARRAAHFTDNPTLMRAAVAVYPDSAVAHRNLGFALLEDDLPQEGIPHLEEALRLNPDSVEAHKTLAVSLYRVGERARSISLLRETLRLRPDDPEALANLGAFLRETGNTAEAIPYLEHSLDVYADSPRAHCNLGKALLETGHPQRAVVHFEAATRLDPGFAEATKLLELAREEARSTPP